MEKILFKLILISISILLCGFREPKYCKLSDRIFFPYNRILKKEKKIHLVGCGGAMAGDIKKVNSSYVSSEIMTLVDARRLFVEITEGYICRYNQNEEIRPYLHDYPVTDGNFKIMIGFEDEHRRHRDNGYIALVFNIPERHRIYYCTYDQESGKFIDLHDESYETARAIVMQEPPQNPSGCLHS